MPSAKKLTRYPAAYFRLFHRAGENSVTVPCDTPRAAWLLRNELYVFRRVLLRTSRSGGPKPDAFAKNPKAAEHAPHLKLRLDGSRLIVEPMPPLADPPRAAALEASLR